MADHCQLCERPQQSHSEFCSLHTTARTNLENAYTAWNNAYGGKLTKEEYFANLEKLNETGQAAKTVIQHLRGKNAGP